MHFSPPKRMRDPEVAAWIALRFAKEPVTLSELAIFAGSATIAFRAVERWRAEGLIIQATEKPESYVMASHAKSRRDPPTAPSPQRAIKWRSGRQRMWSAVRVLKTFDLVQICMAASVSRASAVTYLGLLTRAGFLEILPAEPAQDKRWSLLRFTGPQHPTVEQGIGKRTVVDRNTGDRFFLTPEANHVS